jgi:hypothetical protein
VGLLVEQSDNDFIKAYMNRVLPGRAVQFGPEWVYGVLAAEAVSYIVDNTCWGAIQSALSQLRRIPICANYELKQFMLSTGVNDMFAWLCALSFLSSSGGNAYAGRVGFNQNGKLNGTTYTLSAGFQTRVNMSAQIECLHYWFERVFEQENPAYTKLIHDIDEFDQRYATELTPVYQGRTDADFRRIVIALASVNSAAPPQGMRNYNIQKTKMDKLRISRKMVKNILVHYE